MALLTIKQLEYTHCGPMDLIVDPGTCVGISGESGCGKSLMLRAIADLDDHKGDIALQGIDCDDIPAPQWRQKVALLPADSQWWFDRVGEHFADHDAEMAQRLGFTEQVMDWSVSRLSSGEKQRLALLRILILQPKVLLLDEPTANLDRGNARVFEQMINEYRQQHEASIIWVSHDLEQLQRVCDRQYRLQQGQLIEQTIEQ